MIVTNKKRYASDENVTIIDSSWCFNRSGISLSFAIPIEVLSIDEIQYLGKQFVKAIKSTYKDILKNYFVAKTETPVICATPDEQILMLWSFQGDNDKQLVKILKQNKIQEIKYE